MNKFNSSLKIDVDNDVASRGEALWIMTPRQGMTVMMGMDGRQKSRATNRVGDNSVSWSIVALLGH